MSFENHPQSSHTENSSSKTEPTQAVRDEADKIIARMDGSGDFQKYNFGSPDYDTARALQVRDMLIKDSQTLSPKDMRDLMLTVMDKEDHKKGYDLEIYGHSSREVREKQQHLDQERDNLIHVMANCTNEERHAPFAELNARQKLEMENYNKELVLVMTHHSTAGEYGEKGRTPGDTITVAAYSNKNGLPDFKVVEKP